MVWLITESFPNFCTASNIRSIEESQICTSNLSHLIPHIQLALITFPCQQSLLRAKPTSSFLHYKLYHSSHCLESLSNSISAGWFPWYSKIWINGLWLFYMCGHYFHSQYHIRTYSDIKQRWDHLDMPWKPRQIPLTGLITVGNRHE